MTLWQHNALSKLFFPWGLGWDFEIISELKLYDFPQEQLRVPLFIQG